MSYLSCIKGMGADAPVVETPTVDVGKRFDALDLEIARLNATAEKDLFWRRVTLAFTAFGALWSVTKIVDVFTYLERRRRTSEGT